MVYSGNCKRHSVGQIDQSPGCALLGLLQLQEQWAESDTVRVGFHTWQHETRLIYRVFHEAINCVLELFGGVSRIEILVPRARGQHEGAVGAPGETSNEGLVLGVVEKEAVGLLLVLNWCFDNLG